MAKQVYEGRPVVRERVSARTRTLRIVLTTVTGAFALVWVGTPLWMILINSVESERQAGLLSFIPKGALTLNNYKKVIQDGGYLNGLQHTLIIAVPAVFVIMLVGAMAAWSIARSKSRLSSVAYYCLLGGIFAPPSIITTIFVLKRLHLNDSLIGITAVYTGLYISFALFLFTGFCRVIPTDLEEAARLDGAGWLSIFIRIILPLMKPILLTAGVLLLVSIWNDFQYQFFLVGSSQQTLTTSLYNFAASSSAAGALGGSALRWNLVFADVVLTSLPLTIIYIFVQRRLTENLLAGSLRG